MSPGHQTASGRRADRCDEVVVEDHAPHTPSCLCRLLTQVLRVSPGHQTAPGRSADRRDVVVVEDHTLVRCCLCKLLTEVYRMSPAHQTAPCRRADRQNAVVVEDHALVRHVVYVSYLPMCIGCLLVIRLLLVGVQIGET